MGINGNFLVEPYLGQLRNTFYSACVVGGLTSASKDVFYTKTD